MLGRDRKYLKIYKRNKSRTRRWGGGGICMIGLVPVLNVSNKAPILGRVLIYSTMPVTVPSDLPCYIVCRNIYI